MKRKKIPILLFTFILLTVFCLLLLVTFDQKRKSVDLEDLRTTVLNRFMSIETGVSLENKIRSFVSSESGEVRFYQSLNAEEMKTSLYSRYMPTGLLEFSSYILFEQSRPRYSIVDRVYIFQRDMENYVVLEVQWIIDKLVPIAIYTIAIFLSIYSCVISLIVFRRPK